MKNNRGLGKGLSALFSETEEDYGKSLLFEEEAVPMGENVKEIDITKVFANPNQPRKVFDAAALDELGLGSDIAVVDLAYANYYINALNHNELMILSGEDFSFAKDEIVIACKKGSDIDDYINAALYAMQENKYKIKLNNNSEVEYNLSDIVSDFGMAGCLLSINEPNTKINTEPSNGSAWSSLSQLKVGFTAEGNATGNIQILPFVEVGHYNGYDGIHSLVSKSICSIYNEKFAGVKPYTFDNVIWENRKDAINNGTVDILLGNFTKESIDADDFDFTVPFLTNSTAIVIKTADKEKFTTYASMKSAKFVAVSGSKHETLLKGDINAKIFG